MVIHEMPSSSRNPGTEAFDRVQRKAVPIVIVAAAVLALFLNDVPAALFPVAVAVAAIYLLLVVGGARVISTFGTKLIERYRRRR